MQIPLAIPTRWIVSLLFCIPLLAAANESDERPDLLGYPHKNLETFTSESLEHHRGRYVLMMFFEPGCRWCLKQMRALNQLKAACPAKVAPVALGIHGDAADLRHWAGRARPDFPIYAASERLVVNLGGIPATPYMLVTDRDGRFVTHVRGYLPLQKLRAGLAELDPGFARKDCRELPAEQP